MKRVDCLREKIEILKNSDQDSLTHKTIVVSSIQLEMKPSYFVMGRQNNYAVCLLKHEEIVLASRPVAITSDIAKFPDMRIENVSSQFMIHLEIYGTDFKGQRNSKQESEMNLWGFLSFSVCDLGRQLQDSIQIGSALAGIFRMNPEINSLAVIPTESKPEVPKEGMSLRQILSRKRLFEGN